MEQVILKRKIAPRVLNGHPWVFSNEIEKIEGEPAPAAIVDVLTHDKKFVGRGYFNPKSQIPVRILTRKREEGIDASFFLQKIKTCWAYRQRTGYTENCRLVFGEADGLPQLIIDKFNDYFVIHQFVYRSADLPCLPNQQQYPLVKIQLHALNCSLL